VAYLARNGGTTRQVAAMPVGRRMGMSVGWGGRSRREVGGGARCRGLMPSVWCWLVEGDTILYDIAAPELPPTGVIRRGPARAENSALPTLHAPARSGSSRRVVPRCCQPPALPCDRRERYAPSSWLSAPPRSLSAPSTPPLRPTSIAVAATIP